MYLEDKNKQLKSIILEKLSNEIKGNVVILGIPIHGNIGDLYITLGELELFKELGVSCKYMKLLADSTPIPEFPDDYTIILQGGGDFGDVWRGIHEYKLKIIERFNKNKIIILSETVEYFDKKLMEEDAKRMANHVSLTICARDQKSYDLLKKNFSNKILLVPDMAFCISRAKLISQMVLPIKKGLYLKRNDKELNTMLDKRGDWDEYDISDWPTVKNDSFLLTVFFRMVGYTDGFYLHNFRTISRIMRKITLWYAIYCVIPSIAKLGVKFISSYKNVVTTRMHAAILSVLLNKKFVVVNNSYDKNKNYYLTWLSDVEDGELLQ